MAEATLMQTMCEMPNLTLAWRKVRANVAVAQRASSAGVDEVSVAAFEQQWEANLAELQQALLNNRYQPLPPRRVEMGKPGGGTRVIGVLAVRDRVAQRAAQQVLEPLFEEQFLDCSYGFRPGRSVDDAVHRVMCYHQGGCEWVFDADIAACFDSLDHRQLLHFVEQRTPEPALLDLIQSWLEVGVLNVDGAARGRATERWAQLWNRIQDILTGQAERMSLPDASEAAYLDDMSFQGGGWDAGYERRSLLQRAGNELFLLGLAGIRPLATHLRATVRWLARRKRLALSATGALGLLGLAGLWWGLQQWEPHGQGAVQGGALSPLLANVYLHHFDAPLAAQGRRLVRFADDFVICCETRAEAETAAGDAARVLSDLQLRLNLDKTRVASFERGFQFLGRQFHRNKVTPPPRLHRA